MHSTGNWHGGPTHTTYSIFISDAAMEYPDKEPLRGERVHFNSKFKSPPTIVGSRGGENLKHWSHHIQSQQPHDRVISKGKSKKKKSNSNTMSEAKSAEKEWCRNTVNCKH